MEDLRGIISALAPDHIAHAGHEIVGGEGGDIEVKCGCSVRLTFLSAQLAALKPKAHARPKAVGDGS